MGNRALLNLILEDEALTRGLGDEEARLLIEWLAHWAEQLANRADAIDRIQELRCRGRAIRQFVELWSHRYAHGAALQLAAGAIRSGQYDCALVFGVEKMPKGIIRSSFFEPWREQGGLAATPAYFALRAQRLLRDHGLTKDDLARVVVKNRRHGVHNENAMFRKEVTADEVLASRVVCEPLHLWMLCSPNEGAAAVVLQRASNGHRQHQRPHSSAHTRGCWRSSRRRATGP